MSLTEGSCYTNQNLLKSLKVPSSMSEPYTQDPVSPCPDSRREVQPPSRWSAHQRRKNDLIYKSINALRHLALRYPSLASAVIRTGARFALPFARPERRLAEEQIRVHLNLDKTEAKAIRQGLERHLLQSLDECTHLAAGRYDLSRLRYDGDAWERLCHYAKKGKGLLVATGHLGNWELLAARLAADFPCATVAKVSYDPRLTHMVEAFRSGYGLTSFDRDDPEVSRRIQQRLSQGSIVGILMDQDTKVPGVFVPFFNEMAHTTLGPAALHLKTGAPLVPAALVREGTRHRLVLGSEARTSDSQERKLALLDLTSQLSRFLEQIIREHPEQWVWFHRRWKTRPEASENPIICDKVKQAARGEEPS